MNKYLSIGLLTLFTTSLIAKEVDKPKNIIFMIGDGMGPAYTTAYRYYNSDPTSNIIQESVFDTILTGMARTYPDDNTLVTDSAAAATALSTGVKTYNGAIAVDPDKKPLTTILEQAKKNNMITALVVTSQINHATPASFAAHNEYRRNYNQIANDFIDNKINGQLPVDLMLGGGTDYFLREDRNLVNELIKAGYQYTDSLDTLVDLTKLPALGLFAPEGLPRAIDSVADQLEKMTTQALKLLEKNENGFFLMIEGSQIDWCGHSNDIVCAMHEMNDFANTIKYVKKFVDNNPDTLLVVTADHSTGGLTIGADNEYKWEPSVLKKITLSAQELSRRMFSTPDHLALWHKKTQITLNETQIKEIDNAKAISEASLYKVVNDIINKLSYTGWTTEGHTGVDVQVFSYGQGFEAFRGNMNNTDIAKKLFNIIGD